MAVFQEHVPLMSSLSVFYVVITLKLNVATRPKYKMSKGTKITQNSTDSGQCINNAKIKGIYCFCDLK